MIPCKHVPPPGFPSFAAVGEFQWRLCTQYDEDDPVSLRPALADETPTHLLIMLPAAGGAGCADASMAQLAIRGYGRQGNGATWEWDGNREKPTLRPSIDGSAHGGWHGWLRAGVLIEA